MRYILVYDKFDDEFYIVDTFQHIKDNECSELPLNKVIGSTFKCKQYFPIFQSKEEIKKIISFDSNKIVDVGIELEMNHSIDKNEFLSSPKLIDGQIKIKSFRHD